MNKFLIRKSPDQILAWQNCPGDLPRWLLPFIKVNEDGEVFLIRRSGPQWVEDGEWIIKSFDKEEPEWITDDMRKRDYL